MSKLSPAAAPLHPLPGELFFGGGLKKVPWLQNINHQGRVVNLRHFVDMFLKAWTFSLAKKKTLEMWKSKTWEWQNKNKTTGFLGVFSNSEFCRLEVVQQKDLLYWLLAGFLEPGILAILGVPSKKKPNRHFFRPKRKAPKLSNQIGFFWLERGSSSHLMLLQVYWFGNPIWILK